MRFMIFVKATKTSETGAMPGRELIEAMGKYNQELIAAGIMQDGGGLHPSSKAARVTFSGKDRTVRMGPFSNTSELVSGYWLYRWLEHPDAPVHPPYTRAVRILMLTGQRVEEIARLHVDNWDTEERIIDWSKALSSASRGTKCCRREGKVVLE